MIRWVVGIVAAMLATLIIATNIEAKPLAPYNMAMVLPDTTERGIDPDGTWEVIVTGAWPNTCFPTVAGSEATSDSVVVTMDVPPQENCENVTAYYYGYSYTLTTTPPVGATGVVTHVLQYTAGGETNTQSVNESLSVMQRIFVPFVGVPVRRTSSISTED